MKKIMLAVCLLFVMGSASPQGQTPMGNNDHGQNDCQCIGIGIQNVYANPNDKVVFVPPTPLKVEKTDDKRSMLSIFLDIYLLELRNSFHNYSTK